MRERDERERGEREGNTLRTKDGKPWRAGVSMRSGVSVYVNNIPVTLDIFGLKGIFNRAGRVLDSYIPKRRMRGARARYGFVRYANLSAARRSIQLLNNKSIRGCKLAVSMARLDKTISGYRKPQEETSGRRAPYKSKAGKKEWRPVNTQQGSQTMQSIKGQVNEDLVPWLSRSLVCIYQEPRDISTLASAIITGYGQCSRIYALSGFKFILTYPTEEARDEALRNPQELDTWFSECKKWDRYERCSSRKVWLEVIGVPPHGWSWEKFQENS